VIENAQKKVEARNFDIRKHLLDYDDVMNRQRQAFYNRRREALLREAAHDEILDMCEGAVVAILDLHWPEKSELEAEALHELAQALTAQFGLAFDPQAPPFLVDGRPATDRDAFGREVHDRLLAFLEEKKKKCDALHEQHASIGYPRFEDLERDFLLQILDAQWKDHLHTMDGLREGIGLRGYASRDPKLEYQREGYALFEEMNARIDAQVLEVVFKVQLRDPAEEPAPPRPAPALAAPPAAGPLAQPRRAAPAPPGRAAPVAKVGRNDPCPCGSGRKYKKCHGAA
jgi:preprotein translocase subunit SecA